MPPISYQLVIIYNKKFIWYNMALVGLLNSNSVKVIKCIRQTLQIFIILNK